MGEESPLRVLVIISNKSEHWDQAWRASEDILPITLQIMKDRHLMSYSDDSTPPTRLLAKKKYPAHVFLVYDIANTDYSPENGHLPHQNKLPVTIVRLSQKLQAYQASLPIQNSVNQGISEIHNLNGIGSLPPFVEDHTAGVPLYTDPRDTSLL
ncbi:hypothetical protein BJX96DRAFT_148032 [Aspergillus floccosus]